MKRTAISVAFLLCLALILIVVAGCGEDETTTTAAAPATTAAPAATETTAAPAPVTTAAPTETTAAAGGPQAGGILTLNERLPAPMPLGDPLAVIGPVVMRASLSTERLLLPGDTPGTYTYVLATGCDLAPDKSYYDIHLREGVKFHDGTDFNAEAVKWNYERVVEAKRSEFSKVTSFEVIDPYTLRMNLSEWNNQILNDLMNDDCAIISPTAFQDKGADWAANNPVGTGPFVFKEIRNNQVLVWEKNPNYWQAGLPYLDGIELDTVTDTTTANAAFLAHELDGGQGNFADANKIAEDGTYDVWVCDGEFTMALIMNTESPDSVWSDVRMRQALEYAIDKDTVLADAGAGYIFAPYVIVKGLEEVAQVEGTPRTYDPEKAKALMAEAGYADGVNCTVYVEDAGMSGYGDFYLPWQEQWKAVGINIEFSIIDHGAMSEMGQSPMPGNDMRIDAIRGNPDNPTAVIIEVLSEGTVFLQGAKRPAEWPALLDIATHSDNPDEILKTLVQMDKLAYDDAMFIPLHTSPLIYVMDKKVHDFKYIRQGYAVTTCWKEQ